MKRPLPLLLIAIASLSAGCASTPQSDAERLTSDIMTRSSQNLRCASDEIPACLTNGTRIHRLNPQKTCECLVRELVMQPPR